jgi:hypothetical protein
MTLGVTFNVLHWVIIGNAIPIDAFNEYTGIISYAELNKTEINYKINILRIAGNKVDNRFHELVVNSPFFPGQTLKHYDHHQQQGEHHPKPHLSASPSNHPSSCMVHHKEPPLVTPNARRQVAPLLGFSLL